jgi:hypothetical protein
MSRQHHPARGVMLAILFLLILLAIAAGPIGFAVLVMVGVPVAIMVAAESMAHSRTKIR